MIETHDTHEEKKRMAYMITKQPAWGCFHEEGAGRATSDVHVIDLQSAEDSINTTFKNNEDHESVLTGDNPFLPAVYLSLTPDQRSYDSDVMHRNLTLILNSRQKVKWFLESQALSGQLKVISTNGPVSNYDLAPNQQLLIERKPLPAAFDQLWKAVVSKTGNNPISYARVDRANVLTIIVPTRSKRAPINVRKNEATIVPDSRDQFILIPRVMDQSDKSRTHSEDIKLIQESLSKHLVKKCNQQRTVIALPISATTAYDVVGMHLNEAKCTGTKNSTHWIVETKRYVYHLL